MWIISLLREGNKRNESLITTLPNRQLNNKELILFQSCMKGQPGTTVCRTILTICGHPGAGVPLGFTVDCCSLGDPF